LFFYRCFLFAGSGAAHGLRHWNPFPTRENFRGCCNP
jgi:hypothetical protein